MVNGSERNFRKCPSTLEKRLTYISWTLFTVAVSLAMGILIILRDKNSSNECLSPSCIHSAAMILQTVDGAQNPCDNFYKFSCGNYLKESYVQNNQLCLDNFVLLHERIQEQLKIIIENPLSVGAPKPYRQLQILYNLCMNTTAIEREGMLTALDIINSVGSCPLLIGSRWNATNFHWTNLVYNLKRVGLNHEHFITLKVSVDEKNSSYHILTIEPTKPSFANYSTPSNSVLNRLSKILKKFGVSTSKSLVELKEVLDFAARLSKIYVSYHPTMNRSAFYNQMTIRELQYRFPKTDWMEYVTNIVSLSNVTFSYKEIIVVRVPQYLSDLETLLDNTSSEVQANYIIVRILVSLISLLSRDSKLILGNDGFVEQQPVWKECIDIVQGSVGLPLLAMYADKYFKNRDYEQVREIAIAVQEEFRAILNESEWLDEITRQIAIDKLNASSIHVGLPSLDDTLIYYEKLEISSENYLKARLSVNSFLQHMHYNRLRQLVIAVDWMDRTVLNTMKVLYSQTGNMLHIPAHILQGIFFNASRPRYLNYATVGSLIGNEITIGFNDIGRQYDKHGNINDWWGTKTEALFLEKGQCAPSMFFNSMELRTQVEILGLTGGLKQSYLAYMKWTKRNVTEAPLAGVAHNQEQLFWISAAQLWCRKCGDINFTNDLQSFSEYRVNEAFRNSVNFSRDFKCPLGSPMNPTKKCSIW